MVAPKRDTDASVSTKLMLRTCSIIASTMSGIFIMIAVGKPSITVAPQFDLFCVKTCPLNKPRSVLPVIGEGFAQGLECIIGQCIFLVPVPGMTKGISDYCFSLRTRDVTCGQECRPARVKMLQSPRRDCIVKEEQRAHEADPGSATSLYSHLPEQVQAQAQMAQAQREY